MGERFPRGGPTDAYALLAKDQAQHPARILASMFALTTSAHTMV
jgi:hypothetical protein